MNFDTSKIETPCIEDVEYDVDYRWLTPRAHEWIDKLDRKLIEHYGESFRRKVNHYRVEHGLKTL